MKTPIDQIGNVGSPPSTPLQAWTPDLCLEFCSATDPRYKDIRKYHYVPAKGCHGQQVHFLIWYKGEVAGIISGGGSVYTTPSRDVFFGITNENRAKVLNGIVDNIVFRLINHEQYLGSRVLALWEKAVSLAWETLYEVKVFGFETFIVREGLMRETCSDGVYTVFKVTDPEGNVRKGGMYKAANWKFAGETMGSAKGHDKRGLTGGLAGGKGAFIRKDTPIKDVYCKWVFGVSAPVESAYKSSWKAITPEEKALAKLKNSRRKVLMGAKFYMKAKKLRVNYVPTLEVKFADLQSGLTNVFGTDTI